MCNFVHRVFFRNMSYWQNFRTLERSPFSLDVFKLSLYTGSQSVHSVYDNEEPRSVRLYRFHVAVYSACFTKQQRTHTAMILKQSQP